VIPHLKEKKVRRHCLLTFSVRALPSAVISLDDRGSREHSLRREIMSLQDDQAQKAPKPQAAGAEDAANNRIQVSIPSSEIGPLDDAPHTGESEAQAANDISTPETSSNTTPLKKRPTLNITGVNRIAPIHEGVLAENEEHLDFVEKNTLWSWIAWEITCLIVAGALIGGMAGFLAHYNGKPTPSWPKHWKQKDPSWVRSLRLTFNTVLSIFSTSSALFLGWAITKALAKLAWIWYRGKEGRKLDDIDVFSEAALNNPQGAAKLLWLSKGR
jgi:Protein of unknown function (DUF3176)